LRRDAFIVAAIRERKMNAGRDIAVPLPAAIRMPPVAIVRPRARCEGSCTKRCGNNRIFRKLSTIVNNDPPIGTIGIKLCVTGRLGRAPAGAARRDRQ